MERVITKEKSSSRGVVFLSRKDISAVTIGLFGFFLGRVVIFEIFDPIAIGFLANFLGTGLAFNITALLIGGGLATKLSGVYFFKYIVCLGILTAINLGFLRKKYTPNIFLKSSIAGGVALISGLSISIIGGFSLYLAILAAMEGVLAFSLTYVLKKSTDVIGGNSRKKTLGNEEIISIAILFGGIIAGAAGVYIGGVSLRLFMSTIVVLIVAYKGGSALASMAGVLIGLTLYTSGYSDITFVVILSVAGISAGVLRQKNKLWTALGYFLGGTVSALYLDITVFSTELFLSVGTGCLAFILMPDNFYFNINSSINPVLDNAEDYIIRVKEVTTNKLDSFSSAFNKLSRTFSGLSEKKSSLDQKDVAKLIDDIATKACSSCNMRAYCWQENFYDTYQTIFSILGACEKKGCIHPDDIPKSFRKTCANLENFIDVSNRLFELNKVDLLWHNRIIESRELVSQQLLGVSNLIKNLSNELDLYINFKEDLEENIISELTKNKIEVDSVIVLENKTGKFEVTLGHKPCFGKRDCAKEIAPIVSKVLGRKMKNADPKCSVKKGLCAMRLTEDQKFRIASGVARVTKSSSKESGDSYSFMELKNGQCLLALSDGMGSGVKAREESAAAIDLLEDFIESGFEKDMAIKMINSALVLKSSEDSFSTLDICSIDLYNAEAEFIKIGASTTFLVRNGVVQMIKSTSLPIGILNTVDLDVCTKRLKNNDIIVMVTDGLTEIEDTYMDKGSWIIEELSTYKSANPQGIADHLLSVAEKKCGGVAKDDMTVLVAKIWEKR